MSVEEARSKLLMLVSHEIELDEDAVDRLIDEVRAEMPCCDAWAEVFRRKGAEEEYDLLAFCPTDCTCPCLSCAARARLAVKV